LKQALLLTLRLFFCLSFGFILLNIFVVALFWERGWIFAIGGLAVLYLTVGIGAAVMLLQKNTNPAGSFSCHFGGARKRS
jgi:hypothetical protein